LYQNPGINSIHDETWAVAFLELCRITHLSDLLY
jgi:hypothetical protein